MLPKKETRPFQNVPSITVGLAMGCNSIGPIATGVAIRSLISDKEFTYFTYSSRLVSAPEHSGSDAATQITV
jgi:hypothetical protein